MSLVKFKVCPACDERNPPARLECQKCETDLTGIKVVDENSIHSAKSASAVEDANISGNYNNLVKRCDCGLVNSPQARKCSACGEDISDIRPSHYQPVNKENKFLLRAVDGGYSFTLDKAVTIIGREAEMKDYLSAKSYVSRQHTKFTVADGDVYIVNISTTNSTFVNNTPITSDAPTRLKSGDEIGVGGKFVNGSRQNEAAYFIFEVGP